MASKVSKSLNDRTKINKHQVLLLGQNDEKGEQFENKEFRKTRPEDSEADPQRNKSKQKVTEKYPIF